MNTVRSHMIMNPQFTTGVSADPDSYWMTLQFSPNNRSSMKVNVASVGYEE